MGAKKVPGSLHLTPWFLPEMVILKVPQLFIRSYGSTGIDVDPVIYIQDSGDAGNLIAELYLGQLSTDAETRAVLGLISYSVCFSLSLLPEHGIQS